MNPYRVGCCNGIRSRIARIVHPITLITPFLFAGFPSTLPAQHPEASGPQKQPPVAALPAGELDPSLIVDGLEAVIAAEYRLGEPFSDSARAPAPDAIYSNVTNFTGAFVAIGGADATTAGTLLRNTRLLADDVQCIAGSPGDRITELRFSVANGNPVTLSCRPQLRFFADESGSPGTFLGGYNFNAISFTANNLVILTFAIPDASQTIVIPPSGKLWVGTIFQSNGNVSPTVGGQLNNMGVGLYSPVDLGVNANLDFLTTLGGGNGVASPFVSNNPAGTVFIAPYAQPARHGYELVSVRRGCCLGSANGCVANAVTEKTCVAQGGLAWNPAGTSCVDGYAGTAGIPAGIPDNVPAGGITRSLTITDSFTITDLNLRFRMVHTWYGDVIMRLRHVDTGTQITVIPGASSSSSDFGSANWYVLDDQAATTIDAAATAAGGGTNAIPSGRYRPMNLLSAFHGQNASGTWELYVADDASGDAGTLNGWGLEIAGKPSPCTSEPVGACCIGETCTQTTQAGCAGTWTAGVICDGPQTYSASPSVSIPDINPTGVSSTITVTDSFAITDANVRLQVTHTWVGDLIVRLSHNGGTPVTIVDRPGFTGTGFGCNQPNYNNVILDDQGSGGAIETICLANLTSPPNYTPNNPLSAFNGENSSGTWTLTISDNASGDTGTLVSWSIILDGAPNPCAPATGACCTGTGCVVMTEADCGAANGYYYGDDEACPNLDDGDDCTTDSCDPSNGDVVHTPIDCNDDDPCTQDSCDNGNCLNVFQDADGDGVCDANDVCPGHDDSADADGDSTPDGCDGCPNDPDKTAPGVCGCGVNDVDSDGDGTADCNDNCPSDPDKIEPGQCGCGFPDTDTDGDGTADCNDNCPSDPDKIAPGACGCGVSDLDSDGDGTADCNDGCPADPEKITPGQCGCGAVDTDTDGDGTADCNDGCPNDPDKTTAGQCGCGVADTDTDSDGTADCNDNCALVPNSGQQDTDRDGVGDVCDNCPSTPNPGQEDSNNNNVGDVCEGDVCPTCPGNTLIVVNSQLARTITPNTCVSIGEDQVIVELWAANVVPPGATGFQAFLEFEAGKLAYNGADSSYGGSFPLHVQPIASAEVQPGNLNLDGSLNLASNPPGLTGNILLATLVFDVIDAGWPECTTTAVIFRTFGPFVSELSYQGSPVSGPPTSLVISPEYSRDVTAPAILCSADDASVDAGCAASVSFSATITDNCCLNEGDVSATAMLLTGNAMIGAITYSTSQVGPTEVQVTGIVPVSLLTSCPATVKVSVMAVDCCGNDAKICEATANVNDAIAPVIACPADATIECSDSTAPSNTGMASATDNCPGLVDITWSDQITPGACASNKTIERTWIATDACGNTDTCVQTITVQDTTAPTIVCSATGASVDSECEAVVLFSATATDNCCISADDVHVSISNPSNNAMLGAATINKVQVDGNTVQITGSIPVSALTSCPATIQIEVTGEDCCGHAADLCITTVDVTDTIAPVITCPADTTVECGASTLPAATGQASATDNCAGIVGIIYSDQINPSACTPAYEIVRTWTAIDSCNNSSSCEQLIHVVDTTAPTISCSITGGSADSGCEYLVSFSAAVADNCCIFADAVSVAVVLSTGNATLGDPDITVTQIDPTHIAVSGTVLVSALSSCPATVELTVEANDCCGNAALTCSESADVNDVTPPLITCPPAATVECNTSVSPGVTGTPTVSDNCDDGVSVSSSDVTTAGVITSPAGWVFFSQNTASGALVAGPAAPPIGIGSFHMPTGSGNGAGLGGKTWLATSQHSGLLLSALTAFRYSTYVSPSSLAAPHLTTAINLYVDLDGNGTRDTTMVFEPVYATLQGPVVQGVWQEWDALTAENSWWYTSNFGALTNAQNEFKPLSHYIGLFPNAKIVNWGGAPGMNFVSGQNSGGIWTNYDGNVDKVVVNGSTYDFEPATLCSATIKRTWTAEDDCGNSNSCVQTITVQDTTAPVISCPASITMNADAGSCTAVVDPGTATATDNCDPDPAVTATRSDNQPLGAPYPQGVTTITWKATDACGNMVTCDQTVTVNAFNTVKATIVLEGVTVAAPQTRCIRFRADSCGATIAQPITFGDNGGGGGSLRALDVTFDIPCGNWTSLCAKDEQHSLWNTTSLIVSGTEYEATSVIVLKSGDTDNDGDVDINDVTYFIFTYGGPEGVGGCPWNGTRGADFSLNGNVGTEDFTFLSANWLMATSCSCTTLTAGATDSKVAPQTAGPAALTRISTALLQPDVAAAADINRDGVVDVKDVELFETARGLPHTLSQRMRVNPSQRAVPRD